MKFHLFRYWQLDVSKVAAPNNKEVWDRSVYEASEEYKGRMVSLCPRKTFLSAISIFLEHDESVSRQIIGI